MDAEGNLQTTEAFTNCGKMCWRMLPVPEHQSRLSLEPASMMAETRVGYAMIKDAEDKGLISPGKDATASVKGPEKPPIDKGDPGHHNSQPVKAPKEPRKDTVSDHGEKAEEKNK